MKNSNLTSVTTPWGTFYMGEIVDYNFYNGKKKLSKITEIGSMVLWVQHLEDNLLSSGGYNNIRKDKLGNLLYG